MALRGSRPLVSGNPGLVTRANPFEKTLEPRISLRAPREPIGAPVLFAPTIVYEEEPKRPAHRRVPGRCSLGQVTAAAGRRRRRWSSSRSARTAPALNREGAEAPRAEARRAGARPAAGERSEAAADRAAGRRVSADLPSLARHALARAAEPVDAPVDGRRAVRPAASSPSHLGGTRARRLPRRRCSGPTRTDPDRRCGRPPAVPLPARRCASCRRDHRGRRDGASWKGRPERAAAKRPRSRPIAGKCVRLPNSSRPHAMAPRAGPERRRASAIRRGASPSPPVPTREPGGIPTPSRTPSPIRSRRRSSTPTTASRQGRNRNPT